MKTFTLSVLRTRRWVAAVALAVGLPTWAQTAAPTQSQAQLKLDSVATYLAKTVGYPKTTAAARTELQALYDAHRTSAATMSAETYSTLTTKLAAYRTSRTDIQYPTKNGFYTITGKGHANATTSATNWAACDVEDSYVFHTVSDNGKFQYETTKNTATPLKYAFQLKEGAAAENSFSLYHIETSKYIGDQAGNKSDAPYNFTLEPRGDGRFLILRSGNRPITLWKNGRLDALGVVFEYPYFYYEFAEAPLNGMVSFVTNNAAAGGRFSWNGQSVTGSGTILLGDGATITSPALTYTPTTTGLYTFNGFTDEAGQAITEITAVAGSKTVRANFTPTYFSSTYGEKWVRVAIATNQNVVWGLPNTTTYNGELATMADLDFASESTLWCFVGTADNFKIYNKVVGEQYALTSATPGSGVKASFTDAASAAAWRMSTTYAGVASSPGVVFYTAAGDGMQGLNGLGGARAGNQLGYYAANDPGSHWVIKDASVTAVITNTLADLPADLAVSQRSYYKLPFRIDGTTTTLKVNAPDANGTRTLYLPKWLDASITRPMPERAYAITSMQVNGTEVTATQALPTAVDTVKITIDGRYADPTAHTLFASPDSVHRWPFRIPAISKAFNGDLIAVTDHRPDFVDLGMKTGGGSRIDLLAKISKDNGRTWGNTIMLAQHSMTDSAKRGFGDAAICTDRESNKVFILAVAGWQSFWSSTLANPVRMVRIDGVLNEGTGEWDWNAPVDITDYMYRDVMKNQEQSFFAASGRVLQSRVIKKGDYYRVYTVLGTRPAAGGAVRNRVVYSDDFGHTWHHLGDVDTNQSYIVNADEAKAEELPDGTVIVTVRSTNRRLVNVFTYGTGANDVAEGKGTWATQGTFLDGHGNSACNGETYFVHATKKATGERVNLAMQTVPTGNGRTNVSLFYKEINEADFRARNLGNASTWQKTELTPHTSAYSTLDLQEDGKFGFFFEENYDGNMGYDMNYFARTLEELTNDQYTLDQPLAFDESGYAAFVAPFPVILPDGVEAHTAHTENEKLVLTPYGSRYIAAHTPVILKGTPSTTYYYQETRNSRPAADDRSQLVSVQKFTNVPAKRNNELYYTVGQDTEGTLAETAGFYVTEREQTNGQPIISLRPDIVYLKTPFADALRGYRFNGDDITGIATATAITTKAPEAIYDLTGRRREAAVTPGLYIIGGKKVVVRQ